MPEFVPYIDDDDKREVVIGIAERALSLRSARWLTRFSTRGGVRVRELPITPDKILSGLMAKGGTHEGF